MLNLNGTGVSLDKEKDRDGHSLATTVHCWAFDFKVDHCYSVSDNFLSQFILHHDPQETAEKQEN